MSKALSLLILATGFGIFNAPAQVPSVLIVPDMQRIQRDSTGLVRIRVTNIQHLHAYHVRIAYDPSVVRCTRVRGLGFFNTQTFFAALRDTMAGLTTVDEASLGPSGQSGSGDLVELSFLGLVDGSSTLTFVAADFRDTVNQVIVVSTDSAFIHVGPPSAVQESGNPVPQRIRVESYPNPFNPATTIRYYQDRPGRAVLQIFSLTGAIVFSHEEVNPTPGIHAVIWGGQDGDGSTQPTGVYFVRVQTASGSAATKIILIK